MNSFHSAYLGLVLLLSSSSNTSALSPDGGKWFHPGRPFTVAHQTPTRHVGKDGTKLQSDPYGMPSYGQLDDDAFLPVRDDPSMAVMDFGRPPRYQYREPYRPEPRRSPAAAAAGTATRPSSSSSPTSEPPIREYERQEYFRPRRGGSDSGMDSFSSFNNRRSPPYQVQRPVGMGIPSHDEPEEDYFFAGHPSFGNGPRYDDGSIPSFFQRHESPPPPHARPTPSFSFAGRPSTSFHQRPLQPNFY